MDKTVKSLVLTGYGINCEEETAAAYKLAGAEAHIAHLNDYYSGDIDIREFDILNFPGGFSFGDDLGSGKVLANMARFRKIETPAGGGRADTLLGEISTFVARGGYVLGICNGFQALVRMGLLPGLDRAGSQEVSLMMNDSGKFEDRWCALKVIQGASTPFLEGLDTLFLPVRHGEGKLAAKDALVQTKLVDSGLIRLVYSDESGEATQEYPANPNGSLLACAGLTNKTGHVFGLMPHPEACLSFFNSPDWPLAKRRESATKNYAEAPEADGLKIFQNIVRHIKRQKRSESDQTIGKTHGGEAYE
jgi:phosphoribosylformylglycinamidine synthase subunit PurQ / glutaminase